MVEAELAKVKDDVKQLLVDLRAVVDEAIVRVDLGGKDLRDAIQPLSDRMENGIAGVRSRIGL